MAKHTPRNIPCNKSVLGSGAIWQVDGKRTSVGNATEEFRAIVAEFGAEGMSRKDLVAAIVATCTDPATGAEKAQWNVSNLIGRAKRGDPKLCPRLVESADKILRLA
jgi:hypothetical protein